MELAVKTLFLGLSPMAKIVPFSLLKQKQRIVVFRPNPCCRTELVINKIRYQNQGYRESGNFGCLPRACVALSGAEDVAVSTVKFNDFRVTTSSTNKTGELKISVEVTGARTRAIFDSVFDKMVEAAQPIPGFRRVKGGKTPNIPRDVLLEILGPTKVYMQVIKKVINSTISEYVEKEGLKAGKDLRIEQSFEDLEEAFEPDETFNFDAVVQLQETN